MPRNRVIYQTEALYVAATGDGAAATQLKRVQSANYSFDIARQDVNQYGQLARIDSIILDPPTVSLDYSYYVTDGTNEDAVGFSVSGQGGIADETNFLSGLIADQTTPQENNYYIATVVAGNDAVGAAVNTGFIAIGNGVISNYSVDAAVGDLPTASVTIEGSNMAMSNGESNTVPNVTINKQNGQLSQATPAAIPVAVSGEGASALRPGDITVTTTGGIGVNLSANNFKPTSASMSFDLAREDINKLGSKFAFAKEIDFPVTCTFTTEGIMADTQAGAGTSGALHDVVLEDGTQYTLTMKLDGPTVGSTGIEYQLKGAKLDSQSFSSSIGDNKTVSFTFSAQLGGPQDTAQGLFARTRVKA